MKGDYTKQIVADSFYLAQVMRKAWIDRGYEAPPVLAIERELLKVRAQIYLHRRRKSQKRYRYEKKLS